MKIISLVGSILLLQMRLFSQSYDITFGNEIKLKKGILDLEIISADNTGMYFVEEKASSRKYDNDLGHDPDITLHKIDEYSREVFDKDYDKELDHLMYHSFQQLNNNFYLFATEYNKKEKTFKIHAARVNKNSGELEGGFKQLGAWPMNIKNDVYRATVSVTGDGKAFMLVTNIARAEEKELRDVKILDQNLGILQNTVLDFELLPEEYVVADIKYARNKKIIVIGEHYETKRTKNFLYTGTFIENLLTIFNEKGVKEKEVPVATDGRFIIGGKLVEEKDGNFLYTGFYTNSLKRTNLSGAFLFHIDIDKGEMVLNDFAETNVGMLKKYDEIDPKARAGKSGKDKKTQSSETDGDGEIPWNFVLRSANINEADQSIILIGEMSGHTIAGDNSFYENNDLLIIKTDMQGKIFWTNIIRKRQFEYFNFGRFGYSVRPIALGQFSQAGGMPFYSSYSSSVVADKLVIIMNDYFEQTTNPTFDEKLYNVYNFEAATHLFALSVDLATGKIERKIIIKNSNDQLMSPRHARVVNNEFYIPSIRIRNMSRTEIKFSKLEVH